MGDVAYQNKDIVSKILTEGMKEKSFAVYGVPMSRITEVLPVNLPVIEANEMATDNLFRLEDDSYAIVDYESSFSEKSKIKYVCHIARILKRYGRVIKIRMIVLCTSSVRRINTVLDAGCLQLSIEPGYLSSIETDTVLEKVRGQIEEGQKLSDTEVMQLIVLPLTVKKREEQKEILEEAINLAKKAKEEEQQMFILSGVITFADKIIEPEYARRVEEWIKMTKVGRLFEEEKQQAVAEVRESLQKTIAEKEKAVSQAMAEKEKAVSQAMAEKEKAVALAMAEKEKAIALAEKQYESLKFVSVKLLLKGSSPEEVSKTTGLSIQEIEEFLR